MLIATACLSGLDAGLDEWNATAVVSATSHRRHAPLIEDRPQLVLSFHDIETAFEGRSTGARASDLHAFLDFIGDGTERLLIHCAAGLSRSPALAVVALVSSGMGVDDACMMLAAAVPEASPNRRVLQLGGSILGLDRDLERAAVQSFGYRRDRYGAHGTPTGLRLVRA